MYFQIVGCHASTKFVVSAILVKQDESCSRELWENGDYSFLHSSLGGLYNFLQNIYREDMRFLEAQ